MLGHGTPMTRLSQLRDLGLFDASVPRYTSYPTAPHFTDAVDMAHTERWLAAVPCTATVSIYVHIPFCERLCWFCACRTQGVRRAAPVASYIETLKVEIAQVATAMAQRPKVVRLHWGGGTPTILTPAQITDLLATLHAAFDFMPGHEFSVEIDPTLVDADKIKALRAGGMNRASIGIQDFDPRIQAAIGRPQSYERTHAVVEMLRAAGVQSLNTDIVYGLPHQTLSRIARSTQQVVSLNPDRVALFGYAHVPWVAKRQQMIDPESLPPPEARLALVEQTEGQFEAAGYVPLGIDHFARPDDGLTRAAAAGRLRRNFQGYTDDGAAALVGLGASAISRFPQGYAQNAPATAAYAGRIQAGQLATVRGYVLRLEDRIRATVIERLLCDMMVDLAALRGEFGGLADVLRPGLKEVARVFDGWVDVTPDRLTLRPEGKPLARLVAASFDGFLKPGGARHSQAI